MEIPYQDPRESNFGAKPQAASSKGKIIFDNISFVWDKMILIKRKE